MRADSKIGVLIFTGLFYPHVGGMEKHIYEVSQRLSKKNFDIAIITCNPGKAPPVERMNGFMVYRLPSWSMLDGLFLIPKPIPGSYKLLKKILEKEYNLVCTHNRFFLASFLGFIVARLKKLQLLHSEHTPGHYFTTNILVSIISRIYDHTLGSLVVNFASKTVADSQAGANFLKHLGVEHTEVIPSGVDLSLFTRRETNLKSQLGLNDTIIITFVGRLVYLKGVQDLIHAFAGLGNELNARLIIVGSGSYEKNLKKLANESEHILFLGQRNQDEVIDILNITDIFILPSYADSCPLVLAEAGSLEIPIITTDTDAGRNLIQHYKTGLLFKTGDIDDLKSSICQLIENPSLRKTLGQNASTYFHKMANWDDHSERWAEVFKEYAK